MDEKLFKLFEQRGSICELGLLVERRCDGELVANVDHVHVHSRRLECGYAGSGPADLALSALNALFPPLADAKRLDDGQEEAATTTATADQKPPAGVAAADGRDGLRAVVRLGWEGVEVSRLAWELHHDFEAAFLVTMDEAGGWVAPQQMLTWVSETLAERQSRDGE